VKKIPTLFLRDPGDMRRVTREAHPDCQWVLDGEGVATRKYDGTCMRVDETGQWYARREVKPGKTAPPNFEPVMTDETTGKTVGWEPAEQSAFAKYLAEAIRQQDPLKPFEPGTYELCGAKVNGNPESFVGHVLVRHDEAPVLDDAPRDFDGLAKYLADFPHEGIVWHHPDGRMAKVKVRDFPR
jgi:hypothetical protein